MDPVLSGSLCFLVLAIVMYVKFIREHPWNDDELNDHKTSPVEPDTVPFLHPASPVGVMQKQKQSKQQQQQQMQSPHHGLAVLQKAHQYKNMQGGGNNNNNNPMHNNNASHYPQYLNNQKQPMRRRTHSATVNCAGPQGPGGGSSLVVDGDVGGAMEQLPTTIYEGAGFEHRQEQQRHHHPHLHHRYPPSSGRGQHRINFDNIDFDSESEMEFLSPRRSSAAAEDSLESVPFEDHDGSFLDLESSVSPADVGDVGDASYPPRSPPAAGFTLGEQYRGGDLLLDTPSKLDMKNTAIDRQFVRAVAQPAQMQLEVARKARIPLFLHSPMYVKTSSPLLIDETLPAPRLDHFGGAELPDGNANDLLAGSPNKQELAAVGGGGATPRRRDKLPANAKGNNSSLHIDFTELKVAELIGQGAFGTVHRATWRGTTVAVKILVYQYLTVDILEEFETEVQIMSILRCGHVVPCLSACAYMGAMVVVAVANLTIWCRRVLLFGKLGTRTFVC